MGDAPIGQEVIRILRIKSAMLPGKEIIFPHCIIVTFCTGTPPLQITASGLDPIGPLSLVKALRELPQGETLSVSLSFKPREEARYDMSFPRCICVTLCAGTARPCGCKLASLAHRLLLLEEVCRRSSPWNLLLQRLTWAMCWLGRKATRC